MNITKVNKIEKNNSTSYEVYLEDNGEETIQCFVGAGWDENNFKKFEDKIKENKPILDLAKNENKILPIVTELKQFKNKKVL